MADYSKPIRPSTVHIDLRRWRERDEDKPTVRYDGAPPSSEPAPIGQYPGALDSAARFWHAEEPRPDLKGAERYPLVLFLHGFSPGCSDVSQRWEPPPVPMPPPMRTVQERAADLEYLLSILETKP